MRPHLKFLSGDYLTFEIKSSQSGGSAICRICRLSDEMYSHIIASCKHLNRKQFYNEYRILCSLSENKINFDHILQNEETLTQFILDPCSFNLKTRIHIDDPVRPLLFNLSRDFCYSLDKQRKLKLTELSDRRK